ncbi:MAG: hypothetical protein HN507_10605, partial [Flavobacteriaceae bacterium]|nr:hypothetical protein [Flavobacteriaceae bacterium]
FGLVWDGVSTETCSGQYGAYLKYNNPHKTSLYLLSGLPVIVWDKAAIASFILDNNIGFSVSNLNELNDILKNIKYSDYLLMKANVLKVQEQVKIGQFLKNAVTKALETLH